MLVKAHITEHRFDILDMDKSVKARRQMETLDAWKIVSRGLLHVTWIKAHINPCIGNRLEIADYVTLPVFVFATVNNPCIGTLY